MLDRIREAMVKSFAGAIAVGWLFAQGVLHFAYMLAAPVSDWGLRTTYRSMSLPANLPTGFSLQPALPELVKSLAILLVAHVLLRWLYFDRTPRKEATLGSSDAG